MSTYNLIMYVVNATDLEDLADSAEFADIQELELTNKDVLSFISSETAAQFWYNYKEAYSYLV